MWFRQTIRTLLPLLLLFSAQSSLWQIRAATLSSISMPESAGLLRKPTISRENNDPSNTVRVNGHLAHAHRFIAQFTTEHDASSPNGIAADQEFEISSRFTATPNLVTLALPQISADQTSQSNESDLPARYKRGMEALTDSGQFSFVEPDYVLYATATPNDDAFTDGTLWGLHNTGQSSGVAGADINAEPAWDLSVGSRQVVVAVIDSGTRITHQDLAPNMWQNLSEIAGNGVDDDANGFIDDISGIDAINHSGNPIDETGHGTHVAGTIGALGNGGGRHVGVAWEVQLMALKFLGSSTGFTSDAITCIEYAIAQGADIINASWGSSSFSVSLFNTIAVANQAGILFVAAAGNDGVNTDVVGHYPSNFNLPNVISVAALDRTDSLAGFSNFGSSTVDLGAPGVQIYSTHPQSDAAYAFSSGTSMASPHVAGVAALVKSLFPTINVTDLKARLLSGTVPIPALAGLSSTGGRVDAHGAMTVTGDNNLEFQVALSRIPVFAGQNASVFVTLSDLSPVLDATVTAEFSAVSPDSVNAAAPVTLTDDGIAPDPTAGDGQYSGTLPVPAGVTRVTLTVTAQAAGKNPGLFTAELDALLPPSNDSFASRIQLPIGTSSITGSNVASTRELGEPLNPPTPNGLGGSTVWWTWRAPESGVATITTSGSTFDTTLAVYRGTGLDQLELIKSNDDQSTSTTSKVTFVATAGIEYSIQVDGFDGRQGNIALNYPEVTTATGHARIIAQPNSIQARGGGLARFEVEASGLAPLSYQWYREGIPIQGTNDRSLTISPLALTDEASYSVEVNNSLGNEFSQSAPLNVDPSGSPPGNDAFTSAINLSGDSGSAIGHNLGGTSEAGEPSHASTSNPISSVWWQYQAMSTGALRVGTFGSDFNTVLAAYSGTAVNNLTLLASNDNENSSTLFLQSEISFLVQKGETYSIAVAGTGNETGAIRLDFRHTPFDTESAVNGSFETGDLVGWAVSDFTLPQTPAGATIATTLIQTLLPLSSVSPSDGNFAFVHGFEAANPGTLLLTQTTSLASADLSLVVNYRAGWAFASQTPPTVPRTFSAIVEPVGGGATLASQTILSTGLTSLADTTQQTAVIPLNNTAGQAVNIRFEWNVPEASTGPAFFELDQVRLIQGCESINGLTYSVASNTQSTTQGDHFHSTPITDSSGLAEVGRLQQEEVRGITELDLRNADLASTATLKFQVVNAGGQFGGINDTSFQGSIDVEAFTPTVAHSPDVTAYQTTSLSTLTTLQTSNLSALSPHEIDITSAFNQKVLDSGESLGIRFRANPLPAENSGAWTLGNFTLVLDNRVTFADANLEQAIRTALGIPSGQIKTGQLEGLTSLAAANATIANLQGLEFAINLISLDLRGNLITDIAPLSGLAALQDGASSGLQIENNFLDIAPGSSQRLIIDSLNQQSGLTVSFRPQQIIDTDSDGLDDRFEQRIIDANAGDAFATLADVAPTADFDGDQRTNREEFLRFSDPTDSQNFGRAGDIDRDNAITVFDLIRLNNHVQGTTLLTPDQTPFADVDLSEKIDQVDRDLLISILLQE